MVYDNKKYLEEYRKKPEVVERTKKYLSTKKVIKRREDWHKKYYQKEEIIARRKKYYAKPEIKEKMNEAKRQYNHTLKGKINSLKNRLRRKNLFNKIKIEISYKELNELMKKKPFCFYCGSKRSLQFDHKTPLSKGGKHNKKNVVVACKSCNSSKKDLLISEWLKTPYCKRKKISR